MSIFRRESSASAKERLLIALGTEQTTALLLSKDDLLARVEISDPDESKRQNQLDEWLGKQKKIANVRVDVVLLQGMFQMVQADKPAVDENEIADALVWAVKDLVTMPSESLLLDYIDLSGANRNRINVVAADASRLKSWMAVLVKRGLKPELITVEELALTEGCIAQQFPVLILHQYGNQELLLMVAYQQQLFVSRRIRGFNSPQSVIGNSLMMDSLILETQRAMDYFESGMRQPPVKQIWLNLDVADARPFVDAMAGSLPVNVNALADVLALKERSAIELMLTCVARREELQA